MRAMIQFCSQGCGVEAKGVMVMYDICIYAATPAGIIAAVTAAARGCSVVLLEPSSHIGGMATGGLGWTDFGKEATIGGAHGSFINGLAKEYDQEIGWYFEPHIAGKVYQDMLLQAGPGSIQLEQEAILNCDGVPIKDGARLATIETTDGRKWSAKQFIDASYEGDLMAYAGASYRVGRESRDEYDESLAGVLDPRDEGIKQPKTHFPIVWILILFLEIRRAACYLEFKVWVCRKLAVRMI